MNKSILVGWLNVIIIAFFIASIFVSPSTYKVDAIKSSDLEEVDYFDKLYILKHFDKYDSSEITPEDRDFYKNFSLAELKAVKTIQEEKWFDVTNSSSKTTPIDSTVSKGLMNSAWPMYCHDVRHTGRSPYSTVNTWDEIWRIYYDRYFIESGVAVAGDGTIYYGSGHFFAAYPNGTVKWCYDIPGSIESCPAIDGDGMIYVGTDMQPYMQSFYPNGTLEWMYHTGEIYSSPAIGADSTIYFGDCSGRINALYPNGTTRWYFQTDHVVLSSPAIGSDGTIYCGSHDTYLYALYPNNGTLKWKYKTGDWIRVSPCIDDDGTIYCVSFDCYLYAINPDGTLKWKSYMGEAGTSPTIGWDDTIYCGYWKLHAVDPSNGSVKWVFNVGGTIQGATPCHSAEDIIFFGTHLEDYGGGGDFIAVNPDGTERWRRRIAESHVDSAPAISKDGAVYVGSARMEEGYARGYLYAFGIGPLEADANGPHYGLINQPVLFKGFSKGGYSPHSYHWDFGDDTTSDEQNPTHIYTNAGNYTVTLTVTDNTSNTSTDTTWAWIQETNTQPNKPGINGPTSGKPGVSYDYNFMSSDPDGTPIWYYVEWGDGSNTGWVGQYNSGEEITLSHRWSEKGTYIIRCKAKDPYNAESDWGTLSVTMPLDLQISQSFSQQIIQQSSNQLFLKMLQKLLLKI
jgi:outer membrane protein assembly factor BamB